jgi:hypothetical protein
MARRPARIAAVAAKFLAASALVVLILVVLINLRDPEISSRARDMAAFEPPAIPAESNAYVALLGFTAPRRIDPLTEGKRLVDESESALPRDPFARERIRHEARERDLDEDDRVAFAGDLDAGCDILAEPCLPFARARERAVRAASADNLLLIERYEQEWRLPAFAAVPIAATSRVNFEWSNLGRVHALLLSLTALDAQEGRVVEACGFLQADGAFWRRVLSGAGTLGDKLSALRGLSEDTRLASEIIASVDFEASCAPSLRVLLAPLTAKELSFSDAFRIAFVPTARMLASWPDPAISVEPESWVDRYLKETPVYDLFYRRNASINRSAELYAGLVALAAEPTPHFVPARDAFLADSSDIASVGPGWLYNPLGKMLLARHLPLHVDYIAHAHGVAAYLKLVRMQLDIRTAGVAPAQVPQFLSRAGADGTNPFDGRPFAWDDQHRSLSFDPPDRRWRRWGTKAAIRGP